MPKCLKHKKQTAPEGLRYPMMVVFFRGHIDNLGASFGCAIVDIANFPWKGKLTGVPMRFYRVDIPATYNRRIIKTSI